MGRVLGGEHYGNEWIDFDGDVVYSCGGSMTATFTTSFCEYRCVGGNTYEYRLYAYGTLAGNSHTDVRVSLPVTAKRHYEQVAAHIIDTGSHASAAPYIESDRIVVRKRDSSNWTLGATRRIYVWGSYRGA